jgi:hypothetical protein
MRELTDTPPTALRETLAASNHEGRPQSAQKSRVPTMCDCSRL